MDIDAAKLVDKYMVHSANLQARVFALECQVESLEFEITQGAGVTGGAGGVNADSDHVIAEGAAA